MGTNLREVRRGYADLKDGLQMYYEMLGKGEPVIFIHQSWWNNFEFEKVIPLVAKKFQVFSPDTLGFGFSPPAPWDWEFRDFCDSFIQFMDALGIKKASFVGQHTGALIAADLAARYPKRVDKVVFGGLAIYEEKLRKEKYMRRRMLGWNWGPYVKSIKPGDVIGYEVGILQKKDDGTHLLEMWNEQKRENPDSKIEYVHRATLANMLHYDKGGADALTTLLAYDLEATLPKVKAPSLLIIGSRDCVKPPVFKPITYAGSLISGLVKYKVIYGAGIMGWLDFPEEHAEAVISFLEDPEKFEGTKGHELELAMQEYLFIVEEDLKKIPIPKES
ncbi:MAG: alpha/beta hydrolase [Candidatus Anstonellales archaeon]